MARSDEFGDYDDYGMPAMAQPQGSGRSGLMGRLKRSSGSKSSVPRGFGDDSDDEGVDPGNALPAMNIRELSGLSDRHRYPTSRTMSIASNSTYDTTPIIPTLSNATGASKPGKTNTQYRQRMIDQRKQLLSSETGLPMPGAPGSGVGPASPGPPPRSMSGITDPFSGFSNRAMSMSSQRASVQSRAMSMRGNAAANLSSPVLGQNVQPGPFQAELSNLRNALDREKANSQQLRQAHQHLMAEHRHLLENQDTALEESYHALEAKFYALNEDHERLRESEMVARREAQAAQAQAAQAQAEAQAEAQRAGAQGQTVPDDFLQMHEDLKRDLTIAQQRISAQTAELTSLRQLSRDAPQEHQRLQDINESLEAQLRDAKKAVSAAQSSGTREIRSTPDSAVQELQASHASLAAQVHSLSIELAESSRRELGLPASQPSDSSASQLAKLHAELAEERELRLVAQGHLDKPAEPSARAHAEATQLLDMRNQEYDLLLDKYNAQRETAQAQPVAPVREPSADPQLEAQLGELSQHTAFVESENARLQALLDEHSPKGPLGERLKSVEDQRNVLQDALRALRERKDYEIKLLGDRITQLEARNDTLRVASSGTNRAPSSASFDSEDDDLEMPRIRQQQRPASPLHINFNMDVRGHRERSSPLPLALG